MILLICSGVTYAGDKTIEPKMGGNTTLKLKKGNDIKRTIDPILFTNEYTKIEIRLEGKAESKLYKEGNDRLVSIPERQTLRTLATKIKGPRKKEKYQMLFSFLTPVEIRNHITNIMNIVVIQKAVHWQHQTTLKVVFCCRQISCHTQFFNLAQCFPAPLN